MACKKRCAYCSNNPNRMYRTDFQSPKFLQQMCHICIHPKADTAFHFFPWQVRTSRCGYFTLCIAQGYRRNSVEVLRIKTSHHSLNPAADYFPLHEVGLIQA
ncbi:hypothetical protein GDO78_002409 [Eleutherodactylus coqui]|uniref:Uncharacterized protein n=1 Tax=Eleutherodactylus coqui TaxID=57060 RepID=A0A8J6EVX1_ELECQ|nr:hypothetical protein GDO78_002409 [Eleutherodactylus coqui]